MIYTVRQDGQGSARTIAAGIALMSNGDELVIYEGLYTDGDLNPPSGYSWSAPTAIYPYPGHTVTIKPSSGYQRVFDFVAKSYVKIEGRNTLTTDSINCLYDAIKIDDNDAGSFSHHIRIANTEIMNARGNGILAVGSVDGALGGFNEIIGNHIHGNATFDFGPHGHGLYVTSRENQIMWNIFHDNGGGTSQRNTVAIHIYNSGGGGLDNNRIIANRIYNENRGGAILIADGSNIQLINNLVYSNYTGITLYGAVNPLVLTNTIYGNSWLGLRINAASGAQITSNIVYGNAPDIDFVSGTYTLRNNLVAIDPLFVDTVGFRLQSGSPAIGAGVNCPPDDFYGVHRTYCDIGAVAFNGAEPIPVPPPVPIPPPVPPVPPGPSPLPPTLEEILPPGNMRYTCGVNGNTVSVSWGAVPGCVAYYVRLQDNGTGAYVIYEDGIQTLAMSASITAGHAYHLWVHGYNPNGGDYGWGPGIGPANGIEFSCPVPFQPRRIKGRRK